MNKFLKRYQLLKLTQEEIDNLNRPITSKEIEWVIKIQPTTQKPRHFAGVMKLSGSSDWKIIWDILGGPYMLSQERGRIYFSKCSSAATSSRKASLMCSSSSFPALLSREGFTPNSANLCFAIRTLLHGIEGTLFTFFPLSHWTLSSLCLGHPCIANAQERRSTNWSNHWGLLTWRSHSDQSGNQAYVLMAYRGLKPVLVLGWVRSFLQDQLLKNSLSKVKNGAVLFPQRPALCDCWG